MLFYLIEKNRGTKKKQKMIIGSINNLNDLNKNKKNIHTIFHFAASADLNLSNSRPFETIKSNIIGTVKILES